MFRQIGAASEDGDCPMNEEIPATLLLDPKVIEDPYRFYRQLHVSGRRHSWYRFSRKC
jgi:hypothetical protein